MALGLVCKVTHDPSFTWWTHGAAPAPCNYLPTKIQVCLQLCRKVYESIFFKLNIYWRSSEEMQNCSLLFAYWPNDGGIKFNVIIRWWQIQEEENFGTERIHIYCRYRTGNVRTILHCISIWVAYVTLLYTGSWRNAMNSFRSWPEWDAYVCYKEKFLQGSCVW